MPLIYSLLPTDPFFRHVLFSDVDITKTNYHISTVITVTKLDTYNNLQKMVTFSEFGMLTREEFRRRFNVTEHKTMHKFEII